MIKMYNLSPPAYFAAAARRAGLLFGGHLWQALPIAASDSGASIVDHAVKTSDGTLVVRCFHPRQATVESGGPVAEHFRHNNTWSVPTTLAVTGREESAVFALMQDVSERFQTDSIFDPGWLREYTLQSFPDSLDLPTMRIAVPTPPLSS